LCLQFIFNTELAAGDGRQKSLICVEGEKLERFLLYQKVLE
jgi:hypothetical protein